MLNGDRDQTLHFSAVSLDGNGKNWRRIIDTTAQSPFDFLSPEEAFPVAEGEKIAVAPFGCIVLQSVPSREQLRENRPASERKSLAGQSSYATLESC